MIEESEQIIEQIHNLMVEEENMYEKNKQNFIVSSVSVLFFASISCLSIYFIAIDFLKEPFIPVLMACSIFMALSIYYAIAFGRKYFYRQTDCETARRDRARTRIPLMPQDGKFEEESDSRSSPVDLTDPAMEEPSNLPQTESSTLSEQTSTQESSEKTSLSDSTKGTFTTTAIIECASMTETSRDILSAVKDRITLESKDEGGSKPSTSSQQDSIECLNDDADDETVKVRHRRLTPE